MNFPKAARRVPDGKRFLSPPICASTTYNLSPKTRCTENYIHHSCAIQKQLDSIFKYSHVISRIIHAWLNFMIFNMFCHRYTIIQSFTQITDQCLCNFICTVECVCVCVLLLPIDSPHSSLHLSIYYCAE